MNAHKEWERKWQRELNFWFSQKGEELQRCLVAQGYESVLFGKLMNLFGSGFSALRIIHDLKAELMLIK